MGLVDSGTFLGEEVVVGRQPIVNRAGRVIGYELLYRPVAGLDTKLGGEQMTATVVLGAMTIGIDQLVGAASIFCNADRGVLVGTTPVTLPPERTVLEVLETVAIDDEVVRGCTELVASGYRLALDDFVWVDGAERLLELAAIVKIDVQAVSPADLPALIELCRPYGVRLLAEKVENKAEIAAARALGFDMFQGYGIERPMLVRGRTISTSLVSQLQLASWMLSENLDFEQIERVLRREPAMAVQIIEMASIGTLYGMRRPVRSLREALVVLGSRKVRQWVALRMLGSRPTGAADGLITALTRALMVESIGTARGLGSPDVTFTAGLLSSLDLLLGIDLAELADTVTVHEELRAAAFHRTGALGALVDEVDAYQSLVSSGRAPHGPTGQLDAVAGAAFLVATEQVALISPAW